MRVMIMQSDRNLSITHSREKHVGGRRLVYVKSCDPRLARRLPSSCIEGSVPVSLNRNNVYPHESGQRRRLNDIQIFIRVGTIEA